jgi:putative phosphoribosyl transferase
MTASPQEATTRAALRAVSAREPKTLVLAPPDALEVLRGEADETVCLECHRDFGAIRYYWVDFHQLTDEEVTKILERSRLDHGPKDTLRPAG